MKNFNIRVWSNNYIFKKKYFKGDSNSDYSPNKMPHTLTPSSSSLATQFGQKHRSLIQQRSTPASLGSKQTKFQTPRMPEEQSFIRATNAVSGIGTAYLHGSGKPQLQRGSGVGGYVDHLTGDGRLDSFGRDSSLGIKIIELWYLKLMCLKFN